MLASRYRNPRAADAYGKAVFKHLMTIKSKLESDPPHRQGWLRLLKDVCDYVSCITSTTKTDSKPDEPAGSTE